MKTARFQNYDFYLSEVQYLCNVEYMFQFQNIIYTFVFFTTPGKKKRFKNINVYILLTMPVLF